MCHFTQYIIHHIKSRLSHARQPNAKTNTTEWNGLLLCKYRARWWTLSWIFFYLSLRLFTWSFYRVHLIHLCHYFTPCRSIRSNTIQFIFIDIALMLQMCVKYDQIKRIKQKKSHDIKIKTAKSEAIEVLWSWRFFAVAKLISIAQRSTFLSLNFTYQILPQTLQTLKLANIIFFKTPFIVVSLICLILSYLRRIAIYSKEIE